MTILSALSDIHGPEGRWSFITIEIDPELCRKANVNLSNRGVSTYSCEIRNQLSIPISMLPTKEDILKKTVLEDSDIIVDHPENMRVERYFKECEKSCESDNGLAKAIGEFEGKPDFVLLDSAGHIGDKEFSIFVRDVKSICMLALDDTNHIKHYHTKKAIEKDDRFRIITAGNEKFGWMVAEFSPK
jgi:hypothetical protein